MSTSHTPDPDDETPHTADGEPRQAQPANDPEDVEE